MDSYGALGRAPEALERVFDTYVDDDTAETRPSPPAPRPYVRRRRLARDLKEIGASLEKSVRILLIVSTAQAGVLMAMLRHQAKFMRQAAGHPRGFPLGPLVI